MRGEGGDGSSSWPSSTDGEDPVGFGKEESEAISSRALRGEDGEDPFAFSAIETKAWSSTASFCENGEDPSRVSARAGIKAGEVEFPTWVFVRSESGGKRLASER